VSSPPLAWFEHPTAKINDAIRNRASTWSNDRTDVRGDSRTQLHAHGNSGTRSRVTFRSDDDAARARADQLELELERERAKTAETLVELEVVRAERKRIDIPLPTLRRWKWLESPRIDRLLVALIAVVGLLLVFTVFYVANVLVKGRW
jgi:hypothetical protein